MSDATGKAAAKELQDVERPDKAGQFEMGFGSDLVAQMLRDFEIPYIALNPGASYRGLHDSLVNYLGNRDPQMLIALHEEHAVAMAHGYAKATGRPMAVALHSNVGLLHGSMGIFNAWCDRVPMLILGATGPMDASRRRPWIEWIHTAKDQGGVIRDFVKWDDQPSSAAATVESMLRAWQITQTAPRGPVYVCLDLGLQEDPIDPAMALPDPDRYAPGDPPVPSPAAVEQAASMLLEAERPLILAGRMSHDPDDWDRRIKLAEALDARVLTDLKSGASFPTDHPLHPLPPIKRPDGAVGKLLAEADVVLSLDWIDPAGTFKLGTGQDESKAKFVNASADSYIHNGWSMDHYQLPPSDVRLLSDPDVAVASVLSVIETQGGGSAKPSRWRTEPAHAGAGRTDGDGTLDYFDIGDALTEALGDRASTVIRVPIGWPGGAMHFRGPLDMLGGDGGAGIGSGPGMAVGAALGLRGSGRIPVAILGDGDTLMGINGLWAAAKYRIPLLIIVGNNRAYFNDVLHQDRVARDRGRPPENRWIGQELEDPTPDIVGLAKGLGWEAEGPVTTKDDLAAALQWGVDGVAAGGWRLIDVEVLRAYQD